MKKRCFLLIAVIFTVTTQAICQKDVKLIAKSNNDSILLGSSVRINLVIEGIDLNFEIEKSLQKSTALAEFFPETDKDKQFKMTFSVTPKELGINKYGPYKVKIMGKEIISNEVRIYAKKREDEEVTILMPNTGKVNQEIEIKIVNYSNSECQLELKECESFRIKSKMNSLTVTNGKYIRTLTLKVVLIKEGNLLIDENCFKTLPNYVKIKPMQILIKK